MKGDKDMAFLGVAIFLTCFFAIAALFLYHKSSSTALDAAIKETSWVSLATMFVALCALVFTYFANARTEKLFTGQNIPSIDISPISIVQLQDEKKSYFAATKFSVANYSGFKAFNIGVDLKYVEIAWIREWLKAAADKPTEKKTQMIMNKEYMLSPRIIIKELESGKTI